MMIKLKNYIQRDYIIKLPDGITIPEECTKIHGITNEKMMSEGVDINKVLEEFTRDWMKCHILVAHNLDFDNRIIQAEYHRNQPINWLGRHRKLNIAQWNMVKNLQIFKFPVNLIQEHIKKPKLIELHKELFKTEPLNLHNSLIDVLACFRCFYKMMYNEDIVNETKHKDILYLL